MIDVQNGLSEIPIDLDYVGVSGVHFPITLLDKSNSTQKTVASISMYVDVPRSQKGAHMSRFIETLNDHALSVFNQEHATAFLETMKSRFQCTQARFEMSAPYFIKKAAPVSKKESLLKVDVRLTFSTGPDGDTTLLGLTIPVTSLCPCSKEISKYGAHNQRAYVTLELACKEFVWIEDIVTLVEGHASSPIYALLKRPDEQHVTEKAYENPVFVEDLVRKISAELIDSCKYNWFKVMVSSAESIHDHNAVAMHEWGEKGNN